MLPPSLSAASQRKLMSWFDRHSRPLPWRVSRDAYRIWVSEVMLQQTTVATVSVRFLQFLDRFPDVAALAAADEQDVLHLWQGLGYYNRARNLHRAAKMLVEQYGTDLPDDPDIWTELPGVGRYILGAVLSQAFDRSLPIVEANTKRVLSRLFGYRHDLTTKEGQAWLWSTAEAILPKDRIGDFNQAMMEIGALICTPRNPSCGECPLAKECVANRDSLQEVIPVRPVAKEITNVREVCAVPCYEGKVLICKRPLGGRWGNMWEFPRMECAEEESTKQTLTRLILNQRLQKKRVDPLMTVRYGVTRFRIAMECFRVDCQDMSCVLGYYKEGCWLAPSELANYPLSTPQRKVAARIRSNPLAG
jgi:A/G-specific adenine glycosylase